MSSAMADHPRSRGVYQSGAVLSDHLSGSSPLARGLPVDVDGDQRRRGIIPARAGFTLNAWNMIFLQPDHPRSRGVYG